MDGAPKETVQEKLEPKLSPVLTVECTALLLASCPLGLLRPISSLLQDEQFTEYPLCDS